MSPIRARESRRSILIGISAGLTIVVAGAALVGGGTLLNTMLERRDERNAKAVEHAERQRQAEVVRAFVACSRDALNTEDYPDRMAEIAREALEDAQRCADSPDMDSAVLALGIAFGPPRTLDQMILRATGEATPSQTVPTLDQDFLERQLKTFHSAVDAGRAGRAVQHWRGVRDYMLEFVDDLDAAVEVALAGG